jgi:hypothetical protein
VGSDWFKGSGPAGRSGGTRVKGWEEPRHPGLTLHASPTVTHFLPLCNPSPTLRPTGTSRRATSTPNPPYLRAIPASRDEPPGRRPGARSPAKVESERGIAAAGLRMGEGLQLWGPRWAADCGFAVGGGLRLRVPRWAADCGFAARRRAADCRFAVGGGLQGARSWWAAAARRAASPPCSAALGPDKGGQEAFIVNAKRTRSPRPRRQRHPLGGGAPGRRSPRSPSPPLRVPSRG